MICEHCWSIAGVRAVNSGSAQVDEYHLALEEHEEDMRNREEAQLSRALADYLTLAKPRCVYTAVPNGGSRSLVEAVNLKRQGVIAGAGDFVFTWDFGSGWIELKTAKGQLNPNQIAFREACERLGVRYAIARSLDECIGILNRWELL